MPQGQYPTVLAGEVLTASLLQAFAPTVAYKAVDTSRATFTTLTADPDLVIPTIANAVYTVDAYFNFEGGTAGASDFNFEFTSNGTLRFHIIGPGGSAGTSWTGSTFTGSSPQIMVTNGAGSLRGARISGSLLAGGSAGSLSLLWAQSVSSATATILHAGSWLSILRIA